MQTDARHQSSAHDVQAELRSPQGGVVIAAGGTAGHINPAIALAEVLRDRGYAIRFIGTPHGLESTLVPEAGFTFIGLNATGFNRKRPLTLIKSVAYMLQGHSKLKKLFKADIPLVGIGFGAYVEVAALSALQSLKIPIAIHEQNSVPGLANKWMARRAQAIALTYPSTVELFQSKLSQRGSRHKKAQIILTGNPVRRQFFEATRAQGRELLGLPDDALVLLVFGGSSGARHINQAVARIKDKLLAINNLHVVHATGASQFDEACELLALTDVERERWHVIDYITNMGATLAACDVALTRAGASTIAELEAMKTPALLVPYPYATENHQERNARDLVEKGAACMILDHELDSEAFEDELIGLLASSSRREELRLALEQRDAKHAAERLADVVESLMKKDM